MSGIVLGFALVLMLAAVALLVGSVLPAPAPAGQRLPTRPQAVLPAGPLWLRLVFPLLDLVAPAFRAIPWRRYRAKAAVALRRAAIGEVVTVNHLLALKVLAAIVVPVLLQFLFEMFSNLGLLALAMIGGFMLPDWLIADLRKKRERQIIRTLPGAVDSLSLLVEAGLEFLMAIQRLVERRRSGPLRDELANVLNDIRLGTSRSEALKAFAARLEIPEVSSFVSVLVQADALGASIGPVLQSQAERMRIERFQAAERAGARASQKILFPLVLFIFPAVLIVIIGPVVLAFIYGR
jgi:tight adherence protein C